MLYLKPIMDQSIISKHELGRKIINSNHETPLNLSAQGLKSGKSAKSYELVARIFELIDTLSESNRINVLKKLITDNIPKVLRELIIDLSDKELEHLHEELEIRCLGMRAHPRKDCILTADYCYGDRPYCDFIKDISEGGTFLYSQVGFEKEDEIELSFYFPETELPIKFIGEVVRSSESGVGVRFVKQSNYQKEVLKTLLNKLN